MKVNTDRTGSFQIVVSLRQETKRDKGNGREIRELCAFLHNQRTCRSDMLYLAPEMLSPISILHCSLCHCIR